MTKIQQHCHGFTVIEVVLTVVIIIILTMTAYPSYQRLVHHKRRLQAESLLVSLAGQVERHYADANSYQHITLQKLNQSPYAVNGHYRVQLRTQVNHYQLWAYPVNQANLTQRCGPLWLNDRNQRGAVYGDDTNCWR